MSIAKSLLSRATAKLVSPPGLYVNGTPCRSSLLEDVRLVITSTDLDGVADARKEVPDFKLFEDRETTYEFQVPQRLASLQFDAAGQGAEPEPEQEDRLSAPARRSRSTRSTAPRRSKTCTWRRFDGAYVVELLGKTGEPRPDGRSNCRFKHRDFTSRCRSR